MNTASSWERKLTPRAFVNTGCNTDCTDTSQRNCHNCSWGMTAVKKLMWHDTRTGAQKVLCYDQLHSHHKFHTAHLFPNRCPLWMQACEWLRHKKSANELFLNKIIHRHKVCFTHEVVFNIYNSHIWIWDNPQAKEHKHQDRFSVDTWVGIIKDTIVGHYLLPDRLTDQCYYFLETMLLGCLKVCLSVRKQFYFNHTAGKMSSSGKMTYPERCNGSGDPTAWPPQLHNSVQKIFSCGDTWRST
jgi:hypothetical protein